MYYSRYLLCDTEECYALNINLIQPSTVGWTVDWDQITSRPSRRPKPTRRTTTRRPRKSTRRPKRTTRRPRPQEDDYGLEQEDNYIGADRYLYLIVFHFQKKLADSLFDNGIDFDDYEDNIEENPTFSDLSISTVTPADIEGRVRSLEEIFTSLHVSSEGCQKMLVCHLSKVCHFFYTKNIYTTIFVTRIRRSSVLCLT